MTHPPAVSVIIPLYNDAGSILITLKALAKQENAPEFEVIVIDDGSRDGGAAQVRAHSTPYAMQIVNQPNGGPSTARNHGARLAVAPLILFLDADCTPPPNWVADMSAAMGPDTGFQAVMGTITAAHDGPIPRIVQAEVEERYHLMRQATNGVDFIAAPSCGFHADVFRALGGFDETLRQAEDVEIAYRTTAAGHRIAFVDTAPVAHAHQTGWWEFIRVKHRRAMGRMRVFALYPEKQRHDSWTPMSLKLQFGFTAAAMLCLLFWFILNGPLWPTLLSLALALFAGRDTIRDLGTKLADLNGPVMAHLMGAGFVLARALAILAAVARVKLRQQITRFANRKRVQP